MKQLLGYNVYPGASITVLDWDIIPLRHKEDEPIINRIVIFIKSFSWSPAPSVNTFAFPDIASSDEWTTDTFQKALFDFSLVRDVEEHKCIRMYNGSMDKRSGTWHYSCLAETGVVYGYWIQHTETKRMWKQQLSTRKQLAATTASEEKEDLKCTCKSHYDLRECVMVTYPIGKVCKQDIYDQVVERIGTDNICSSEFDGFLPNHKRWSLYWYYSINVLNHRGKLRRPLPPCFVQAVRDLYPEPSGVCYTGYKPANPKHEMEQVPGTLANKRFKSGNYDSETSSDSDSE
jgi:hypothetical protein